MKKFKMPTAYLIVFIALTIVLALTWFIVPSVYDADSKEVIRNAIMNDDGEIIRNVGPQKLGLYDLIGAPIAGFEAGTGVIVALLISGGFVGVLNKTGALDAGVGVLLKKFKGKTLIVLVLFFISILGTIYGLWEELAAFAIIIVPMFRKAGYDSMTGVAVMFVGAVIGVMSSVINPFSVGTAVGALGDDSLTIGSGIELRMVLFVALFIVGAIRVVVYAERVRKDPSKSITADIPEAQEFDVNEEVEIPEMTKRRAASLFIFGFIIFMLFMGYIPWSALGLQDAVMAPINFIANIPVVGKMTGLQNMTPFGDWYFYEFSILFLSGTLLVGIINKMGERNFIATFVEGASDLLGVCLVLAIARGISVVMGDKIQGMSVTVVDTLSQTLHGVPLWAFAITAIGLFMLIGVFLQSSSGVAALTMPILGVVAATLFASSGSSEQFGYIILISAYTLGLNFTVGIYPDATAMGVIELYHIPYDRYLRFGLKTYIIFIIVGASILLGATMLFK